MTATDRLLLVAFCAMGILSDPRDLPRLRRRGKKLSCSQSVAARAVKQADDIIKELNR